MKFAVLGKNDAALALTADLALRGFPVALYCDTSERGHELLHSPSFTCLSEAAGFHEGAGLYQVENFAVAESPAQAVADADIVYLVSSPHDHEAVLAECGAAVRDDAVLVLPQSGVGGALVAAAVLQCQGKAGVAVAQISAPHTVRPTESATIRVTKKKDRVPLGVLPACRTEEVLARLAPVFPQYYPVSNVLAAGMTRVGMALHPIPVIMGAIKIEQLGRYQYDAYDITPAVARVIEAADRERRALLEALGLEAPSFVELLGRSFGAKGESFYEAVHDIQAYKNSFSPDSVNTRYITDDVPTQVVPMVELAAALGVRTPVFDAVIAFSDAMLGTSMRETGWNLTRLGLANRDGAQILGYLRDGPAR